MIPFKHETKISERTNESGFGPEWSVLNSDFVLTYSPEFRGVQGWFKGVKESTFVLGPQLSALSIRTPLSLEINKQERRSDWKWEPMAVSTNLAQTFHFYLKRSSNPCHLVGPVFTRTIWVRFKISGWTGKVWTGKVWTGLGPDRSISDLPHA